MHSIQKFEKILWSEQILSLKQLLWHNFLPKYFTIPYLLKKLSKLRLHTSHSPRKQATENPSIAKDSDDISFVEQLESFLGS